MRKIRVRGRRGRAAHVSVGDSVGRRRARVCARAARAGHGCRGPSCCRPRRPRRNRRGVARSRSHRRSDRAARARPLAVARGGAGGPEAVLVRQVRVADRRRGAEAALSAVAARPASLATNARLALIGDAAAKVSQLSVMVLAARLLPTRELAALGVCLTVATVLTAALDAGVATVLVRECAADPRRGWASVEAACRIRLPFAVAAVVGCTAAGIVLDRPLDALLLAGLALLGTAGLTLCAVFRGAQALETEAEQKLAAAAVTLAAVAA